MSETESIPTIQDLVDAFWSSSKPGQAWDAVKDQYKQKGWSWNSFQHLVRFLPAFVALHQRGGVPWHVFISQIRGYMNSDIGRIALHHYGTDPK